MSMLSKATGIHIGAKSITSALGKLATGNPIGAVMGLASSAASYQKTPVVQGNGMGGSITFNNPFTQGGGILGALFGPKGKGRITPGPNGACPKGWHLNKHKLADGTQPMSVCVRNRSMNPANGRAIGRAIRRITSGERQYKRVYHILHAKAGGKVMPRHRKRS